jgi:hypothetical protein
VKTLYLGPLTKKSNRLNLYPSKSIGYLLDLRPIGFDCEYELWLSKLNLSYNYYTYFRGLVIVILAKKLPERCTNFSNAEKLITNYLEFSHI